MVAVFSTSATLDPSNQLNRVPGAIDVGGFRGYVTSPTLFNGFPTDIPQDFAISYGTEPSNGVSIVVPASAQFLFVGVPDSFYGDNSDENQDYGVRLSFTPAVAPVPEPATLTLFGLGLASMGVRRWRQRKAT